MKVVVVGAGVGGLVAALELAARGAQVTVLERAVAPGGKMRELRAGAARVDAGPSVFTMRWVFEELFAAVGETLALHLDLVPARTLARHAWSAAERLDLFADVAESADAIGRFAGAAEARGYLDFCARARQVYQTLERPFLRAARPSPLSLAAGAGLRGLPGLWRIAPFATLWQALGQHFHDPRLRQLFGRYATYCGGSPFASPATLMLVAHVEQDGVWLVEGGMHRLATVLAALARTRGATFRYGTEVAAILTAGGAARWCLLNEVERQAAEQVVFNGDVAALAGGRLGAAASRAVGSVSAASRSLSALTWTMQAPTAGFPLLRHNVFFSADYAAEFDALQRGRLPTAPTVYVCAQDRGAQDHGAQEWPAPDGAQRLLVLANAPPTGDASSPGAADISACERATFALLARCGLSIDRRPETETRTTPADFHALFPATGGALYGQSPHGWRAAFSRPGAATRLPGLFVCGGSTHPGPGVPMAALSGRLAAAAVLQARSA